MKYCSDYPDAPPCCSSCHEDFNHGYAPMIEVMDATGKVEALVCCKVHNHIIEMEK